MSGGRTNLSRLGGSRRVDGVETYKTRSKAGRSPRSAGEAGPYHRVVCFSRHGSGFPSYSTVPLMWPTTDPLLHSLRVRLLPSCPLVVAPPNKKQQKFLQVGKVPRTPESIYVCSSRPALAATLAPEATAAEAAGHENDGSAVIPQVFHAGRCSC